MTPEQKAEAWRTVWREHLDAVSDLSDTAFATADMLSQLGFGTAATTLRTRSIKAAHTFDALLNQVTSDMKAAAEAPSSCE